jgi:hypothetical protein
VSDHPRLPLIVLVDLPLAPHEVQQHGLARLGEQFEVHLLIVGPMVLGDPPRNRDPGPGGQDGVRVDDPASFQALIKKLMPARPVVLDAAGESLAMLRCRRWLAQHDVPRIVLRGSPLPSPAREGGMARRLATLWRMGEVHYAIRHRFARWFTPPPRTVVIAGSDAEQAGSEEVVSGHTYDYDRYLEAATATRLIDGPYVVFVDVDLATHPDIQLLGVDAAVTPGRYYAAMRRFFGLIEEVAGMPVVIAAHPRSRFTSTDHPFGARAFLVGSTAVLVRDSSFVLDQTSTALSLAVLWRRPVILVTTEEMSESEALPHLVARRELLGVPLLDADTADRDQVAAGLAATVQEERYAEYVRRFVKAGGEDRPTAEIVAEVVTRLGGNDRAPRGNHPGR